MAIAVSAIVVCSPVESSTSISRSVGCGATCRASLIKLSVTPDMAETTATTWLPANCVSRILRATLRIRSGVPTEVPPYFWTIKLILILEDGKDFGFIGGREDRLRIFVKHDGNIFETVTRQRADDC